MRELINIHFPIRSHSKSNDVSITSNDVRIFAMKNFIEFQPIVLAGGSGSRLTEIRGERAKCLLNVGPYPMIWYPLQLLQKHGFRGACRRH